MDDVIDVLQRALEKKKLALNDGGAVAVQNIRRDDDVGNSGFIFKAEENETFRSPRTLSRDDATGDAYPATIGNLCEIPSAEDAQRVQFFAAIGHGMRADRHARAAEVGEEPFFRCHDLQRGSFLSGFKRLQQRACALCGALHLPESIAAMAMPGRIEEVQRSDLRKLNELVFLKLGDAKNEVVDGREGPFVARANESAACGFVEASDIAEADAESEGRPQIQSLIRLDQLQRAFPV